MKMADFSHARFNFRSIYEDQDDPTFDNNDSPFINNVNTCEYYEPDKFHSKFHCSQNNMSYFHLNCRGLSSNWESFKDLLCNLQGDNFCFDCLGVREVFECERD